MYKACVVVISDKEYTGEEEHISGKVVEDYLKENKFEITVNSIVPETKEIIKRFLIKCCDEYKVDLIITIGKLSLTKELNREIEDINNFQKHSFNYLDGSSSYFTIRGTALIVNFPYEVNISAIPLEKIEQVLKIL
jgi:hypothetical protein